MSRTCPSTPGSTVSPALDRRERQDALTSRTRSWRALDRPYRVLHSERFVESVLAGITDRWLRRQELIGSVDQFADSTDVTSGSATVRRLRSVYED